VKPFDASPRDETLVLIPVALTPFDGQATTAGKEAVKQTKEKDGVLRGTDEKAVYAALEALQNSEDRPQGYTPAEIVKVAGAGGNRRPAMKALAERNIICFGRGKNGELLNGEDGRSLQYRMPLLPDDYTDVLIAGDEDLEN